MKSIKQKIKDLTWYNLIEKLKDLFIGGIVEEAPIDTKLYGRQDGIWSEVLNSGGENQNLQSVTTGAGNNKTTNSIKIQDPNVPARYLDLNSYESVQQEGNNYTYFGAGYIGVSLVNSGTTVVTGGIVELGNPINSSANQTIIGSNPNLLTQNKFTFPVKPNNSLQPDYIIATEDWVTTQTNLTLQQVTNFGNTTITPVTFKEISVEDASFTFSKGVDNSSFRDNESLNITRSTFDLQMSDFDGNWHIGIYPNYISSSLNTLNGTSFNAQLDAFAGYTHSHASGNITNKGSFSINKNILAGINSNCSLLFPLKTGEFTPIISINNILGDTEGNLNFSTAPIYINNTTAGIGGLVNGDIYRTPSGQLMVKY
jgi:hypothetical protein